MPTTTRSIPRCGPAVQTIRRLPWVFRTCCPVVGLLALLMGAVAAGPTQPQDDSRSVATVSVIPGAMSARPGQWFPVAVVIDLKPHWHIHTNDPKVPPELGGPDDYIKTVVSAPVSADGRLRPDSGRIQWPTPTIVKVGFGGPPVDYGVFEGRTIIYLPVEVPADASPGMASLAVSVSFQACDDKVCLPPAEGVSQSVQIAVDPAVRGWPEEMTYPDLFAGFDRSRMPAAAAQASPVAAAAGGAGPPVVLIGIIVVAAALLALAIGFVVFKKVL